MLILWIQDKIKKKKNILIGSAAIREKAYCCDYVNKQCASALIKGFSASKGWFERFKVRILQMQFN